MHQNPSQLRNPGLTKRIDRISNLLGSDWQEPDVALNLQLAVRLHDLAHRIGALPRTPP